MENYSPRRLVENEVIYREVNQSIQQFLDEVKEHPKTTKFYCECSNESCKNRIELTTEQYKDLHKNNRQFIVIAGHEIGEVEKVVNKLGDFYVVEKYIDTPSPDEVFSALKKINAK